MELNFGEWLKAQESSASTRNKWMAALGLQPMYSADVFGRATPHPWVADKLTKKLKNKKRRKKKKRKKKNI
jgi:hypothetical protein